MLCLVYVEETAVFKTRIRALGVSKNNGTGVIQEPKCVVCSTECDEFPITIRDKMPRQAS